ncbi:MAG: hypothetical protein PWP37_957 [Thermotogota bacterium]|nr:hypothetical protein [Thermotogota bacterium]MDK2864765.1 hypothetical protein [Thermotogota bacterium]HCZ07475.1 nucleotide pyrophosphohydrolase [Thermotogota bacterium]
MSEGSGFDLTDVVEKLKNFRDSRDWRKFHDPKNLAMSIAIEAAELMEIFQWVNSNDSLDKAREQEHRVREEVADILLYLLSLADTLQIDLRNACLEKLDLNEKRYPVAESYGRALKYTELKK